MQRGRALGDVAGLAAVLLALGLILAIWTQASSVHTLAGTSLLVAAIACCALGLVCGAAALLGYPDNRWAQRVASLAAVVPLLAALPSAPGVRILGPAGGSLIAVALVVSVPFVVSGSSGRGTRRTLRRAVVTVSIAVSALLAVVREPFLELGCLWYCGHNPWLLIHEAAGLGPAAVAVGRLALAAVLLVWALFAFERGVVLIPLTAVTAAVGFLVYGLGWQSENLVMSLLTAELLMLSAGQLVGLVALLRTSRSRYEVRRLTADLAAHGRLGHVDEWLRKAVHDDTLRVRFPPAPEVPTIAAEPSRDRAVTVVRRRGTVVAALEHQTSSVRRVERALTPVVILAIENDRLHTLAMEQYATLARSRREIVHRGDAARGQLERDLHDGAQQRLLLLGMRLADEAKRGDAARQEICRAGVGLTATALAELRAIANGTVPGTFDQIGLDEALRALAETSPVPVELLVERWTGALAGDAARTAYRVALSILRQASETGATGLSIELAEDPDQVELTLRHDGHVSTSEFDEEDRVGAMRGTWAVSTQGSTTVVSVVLPCA
jgi:signal transduction histidine kinase